MALLFGFCMLKFESATYQISVGNQLKVSVEQLRVELICLWGTAVSCDLWFSCFNTNFSSRIWLLPGIWSEWNKVEDGRADRRRNIDSMTCFKSPITIIKPKGCRIETFTCLCIPWVLHSWITTEVSWNTQNATAQKHILCVYLSSPYGNKTDVVNRQQVIRMSC